MGRIAGYFYLLILHALLLFALLRPDMIAAQHWRLGLDAPEPSPYAEQLHRTYRAMYGARADGRILLIGDSHFQQMDVTRLQRPALNFGIGHDTARYMTKRIADYGLSGSDQPVVIWAGQNDLRKRSVNIAIADTDKAIIAAKGPPLWVLTVPPVAKDNALNSKISRFNQALPGLCKTRCQIIDVAASLTGDNQMLDARYDSGDGIHLNAAGYGIVTERINVALGKSDDR